MSHQQNVKHSTSNVGSHARKCLKQIRERERYGRGLQCLTPSHYSMGNRCNRMPVFGMLPPSISPSTSNSLPLSPYSNLRTDVLQTVFNRLFSTAHRHVLKNIHDPICVTKQEEDYIHLVLATVTLYHVHMYTYVHIPPTCMCDTTAETM